MTKQSDNPANTQDLYFRFANTMFGKTATHNLGLPAPVPLKRRQHAGEPFLEGNVLVGAGPKAKAANTLGAILQESRANVFHATGPDTLSESVKTGDDSRPLAVTGEINPDLSALVFDATGLAGPEDLRALYDFFHPTIQKLAANGRVLIIGQPPVTCRKPARAAAQQALEGFTRSLGKEIGRKGATANLIWLAPNADNQLDSTVRFILSPASSYISGQTLRIGKAERAEATAPATPLSGKVALVTGASRGIGAAIARTLARDGATIIGLDIISASRELKQVTGSIAGNFGQTNYAAAKSGVIGYVEAMARQLKSGITINALAPGFIETQMTASMPFIMRQVGRRMNSLAQGGQPVDVAEAVAWYCHPGSAGVNGNVVRVCGQSIIGR